jgi:hypothetical protein
MCIYALKTRLRTDQSNVTDQPPISFKNTPHSKELPKLEISPITLSESPPLTEKTVRVPPGTKKMALFGAISTINVAALSILTHDLMNLCADTPLSFEIHYMTVSASLIIAQTLLLGLRIPETQRFSPQALLLSGLVAIHLNPSFESSILNTMIKVSGTLLGGVIGALVLPKWNFQKPL